MNTLRWKRTLAALLALSLLLTLLPGGLTLPADAADTDRTAEGPLAERIALWDRVDAAVDARLSAGAQTRSRAKGRASGAPDTAGTGVPTEADFAAAAPDVAAAVEQWEDYLPGSMELREGGVVLWRDRDGVAYGYNPALRAAEALGDVTPAPEVQEILAGDLPEPPDAAPESGAVTSGIRLAPPGGNVAGSPNTGLVMPYYGAQAMWTSQDYYELQRLAEATGGQCDHYYGKYGTIDALADCLETCGVVEVATHGVPGGFCLADTGEITTEDMKDFHAYFTGYVTSSVDGTYQIAIVDGTAVVNHMEKRAPNSFVWIESCSVLKNDKMVRPLMDAGVGAVFGWSQNSMSGDILLGFMVFHALADGCTLAEAVDQMRQELCDIIISTQEAIGRHPEGLDELKAEGRAYWDCSSAGINCFTPEQAAEKGIAFQVFVSKEDPYPGEGHVDVALPVSSTWRLPLAEDPGSVKSAVFNVNRTENLLLGAYKTCALEGGELPPGMALHAGDYWGSGWVCRVLGTPDTPGFYESRLKMGLADGSTRTVTVRILVWDGTIQRTEQIMQMKPGQSTVRPFDESKVPSEGYGLVELYSGTMPKGMTLVWHENDRPVLAGTPQAGAWDPVFRFLMKDGREILHTVHVSVPQEEVTDASSFAVMSYAPAELTIPIPEGDEMADIAMTSGELPPGMRMTFHPEIRQPYLTGTPTDAGTYVSRFRISTYGGKLILYTATVKVYDSASYLDNFTVNLSVGPCRVPRNEDREHLETALTYAGAADQIRIGTDADGKRKIDLDRDGTWDVEEVWDAVGNATLTRLNTCSVTGDSFSFTLSDATVNKIISDGHTNKFARAVKFRFIDYYDLYLDGVQVTSLNRTDPLEDGVFSFDGSRTLTVDGWAQASQPEPLIRSGVPDLEIVIRDDSELIGDNAPCLELRADAAITGPGSLTVSSSKYSAILCRDGAALTLRDIGLTASGKIYALQGADAGEKLNLSHMDGLLTAGTEAIYGFGAAVLYQCQAVEPLGSLGGTKVRLESFEERYDLTIAGHDVTNRNREDILGDGVFSFDGDKTLHIGGDCTADKVVVDSRIEDLNILVSGPSRLETTVTRNAMTLREDTTITGGPLTLVSEKAAVLSVWNNATLTMQDSDVTVSGKSGVTGLGSTHSEKLILHSAALKATASTGSAVANFGGGIELSLGEIAAPTGGTIESGAVMEGGSPAKSVEILGYTAYPLFIEGVRLHDHNMTDPLGNGVFSFDGDHTLTVQGSYAGGGDTPMVESMLPGLIVHVAGEASLAATGANELFRIRANTAFTGGHLTLSEGGGERICVWNDASLTLSHMNLTIEGTGWGLAGLSGEERLIVDGATVDIDLPSGGITAFYGGVILKDCAIESPAGVTVCGGNVLCMDPSDSYYYGTLAGKIHIAPRENATHTVSGRVLSWDTSEYEYIRLYWPETPEETILEQWRGGQYYTKEVAAIPTVGPFEDVTVDETPMKVRSFRFEGVPDGTYKLAIRQFGTLLRYAPFIMEVTVSGGDVDTGDLRLWLYGDVNYDGTVDNADAEEIDRFIAAAPSVFDSGTETEQRSRFRAANVTGFKGDDNVVNAADVLQIRRYLAGKDSIFRRI